MPNLLRIGKKCGKLGPIRVPGAQNGRILLIPFFPEFLFGILGSIQIHRAVNFLEVSTDRLAIFPWYEFG